MVQTSRKISVSLTGDAAEFVDGYTDRFGVTVSEAIRRALALQKFVVDETSDGAEILVRKKGRRAERVQFVFG